MKKEIAERWIDKLENGNIPQHRGYLATKEGGRCCLGILCDIAVEDGVINKNTSGDLIRYGREDTAVMLPDEVMEWSGIKSSTGMFGQQNKFKSLSFLNDTGHSFYSIAQIIKKHIDKL